MFKTQSVIVGTDVWVFTVQLCIFCVFEISLFLMEDKQHPLESGGWVWFDLSAILIISVKE